RCRRRRRRRDHSAHARRPRDPLPRPRTPSHRQARHLTTRAITWTDPHAHHVLSVRRDSPGRTTTLRGRGLGDLRWVMYTGVVVTSGEVIWYCIECVIKG